VGALLACTVGQGNRQAQKLLIGTLHLEHAPRREDALTTLLSNMIVNPGQEKLTPLAAPVSYIQFG
jgi:hypothetical protein